MLTVASVATGNHRIDALLGPQAWASGAITYSFPDASSVWSTSTGDYAAGVSEPFTGFAPLDTVQQGAVAAALAAWAAVANVQFTAAPDDAAGQGTLRFGWSLMDTRLQSDAYSPDPLNKGGDVWLNTAARWNGMAPGSYGYSTLLHEIGHALGLKDSALGAVTLPAAQDGSAATLMSANALASLPGSWVDFEPTTPMVGDIAAIQHLYGANTAHHTGDDVYVFEQGQNYFQTLWDAGGTDTIQWNGLTQGATIDLREGAFSSLGKPLVYSASDYSSSQTDPWTVAIALGARIEKAVGGSAGDELIGNDLGDLFMGRGGNDTIRGGAGLDTSIYASTRAAVTTDRLVGGALQVSGPEGVDTLYGVERALFSDGALGFDIDGLGGQAYRLYRAAFDRAPDGGGLGFWMYHLDRGFNFVEAANNFLNSQEFRLMYGENPTNEQFVRLLYVHVNHREPEPAGNQFWLDAMANRDGAFGHAWTRGEILLQFSESVENKANVVGVIDHGFDYLPYLP